MTHQRLCCPAPLARVALLSLLVTVLAFLTGVAHAAPTRQPDSTPEPTAPAPSTTPSAEPTAPAPSTTPALPPDTATGSPVAAPAQTVSLDITKALVGSDVVQVGQYLTFTIQITNSGATVVTDLPLIDEYDSSVLQHAPDGTTPPPTSNSPGVLRWADLTDTFGDLAPGESVTVTAVFRAIRIDDEVINRARVETGLGSGGGGSAPFEDEADGTVEGGRVIVEKALVESFINLDTPVISFTVSLRNEGFTDIVTAPLEDTYRVDLLSFIGASVPPDAHNPATGELRWDNLLAGLGVTRLRPQETVSFTTVYSVTGAIEDAVVNSANAVDVEDEFGNRVASPRRAEVRIRVAGPGADVTVTPTVTPEEERRPRRTPTPTIATTPTAQGSLTATATSAEVAPTATATSAEATPTASAELTGTAVAQTGGATGAAVPATLPATGTARAPGLLLGLALLAITAGLALHGTGRGRER